MQGARCPGREARRLAGRAVGRVRPARRPCTVRQRATSRGYVASCCATKRYITRARPVLGRAHREGAVKEYSMNKDIFQGKWHQVKGAVKAKWGQITDDELNVIAGQGEKLFGILQQRYGLRREE